MTDTRFRCCQHCAPPCPLDGHKKRCPDCVKSQSGNRRIPQGDNWSYLEKISCGETTTHMPHHGCSGVPLPALPAAAYPPGATRLPEPTPERGSTP